MLCTGSLELQNVEECDATTAL